VNYYTQANLLSEKVDTLHMKKAHCFRFVESKNQNMWKTPILASAFKGLISSKPFPEDFF